MFISSLKRRYPFVLLISILIIAMAGTALAVHELGLFELDENAIDDLLVPGDDWDTLFYALPDVGGSALKFTFIVDPVDDPDNDDIFAKNSKDTTNIADWWWKVGEPNDKNDIEHAFVAAYNNPDNDHLILYFGIDKLDNSGDAAIGVWFVQTEVTQLGDGRPSDPFGGSHVQGDVLVQSDFTNGGDIERLDVYAWDVAYGDVVSPGSPLRRIFTAQDCDDPETEPDDPTCAQVNTSPVDVPPLPPFPPPPPPDWDYWYKPPGGAVPSSEFPTATFFEGGIDITELIGRNPCYTAFIAETRQSQSETAVLEDKAIGVLDLCSINVIKECPEKSKVGDEITYTITIENNGVVTMYKESIYDSLGGDLTGEPDCGASLAPGDFCTIEYTYTVPEGAPDPLENTVDVIYNSEADFTGDQRTASANCSVNLFQPSITFEKTGDDELSKVGDNVDYTITLNNTSSADTPDLICTITDPPIGVEETVILASGASHTINATAAIPDGASDPYVNTAEVSCSVDGFSNVLDDSDSHSVDLFQAAIELTKTGDALSKIGDPTDYTITLNNNSSADTPDLTCTITDAAIGVDETVTLASGASHTINATAEIPDDASDPYVNTASVSCSVAGFPNVLTDSDDHSVNLFQPSITFDKTGDLLSKIGDPTDYTITLNNTSSADTPDLTCTITDATIGVDETVTLASGASHTIDKTVAIPDDASDPYVNTAEVSCSVDGFSNVLDDSDDHSVNLFQPSIAFDKTGDELSKIGDPTDYTITLNNNSSVDTPDLECTITDAAIGVDETVTLSSGASHTINATAAIPDDASDPYVNTASVSCSVAGFPNELTDSDDHSVNLFQPSITFDKTGDALSKIGDPTDYTITLNNTSSADTPALECTITDGAIGVDETVTLASGASHTVNATAAIPDGASDPYVNTAEVSCSVAGFPNALDDSDDHSVNLFQPSITFDKTGDPLSKIGDPTDYTITLENNSSTDTPDLTCIITDATIGVDETVTLASGASHTIDKTVAIPDGASDPYVNTASVSCSVAGFPNELTDSDDHSVNLFQPSITFDKTGDELSKIGDPTDYTITLNNNSSDDTPDLTCTVTDAAIGVDETVTLASGASHTVNATEEIPDGASDPYMNTASVSCSVAGFPNVLTDSDDHSVNLFQPSITFDKTGDALSKVGDDVDYTITLENTSSDDTPDMTCTITDGAIGVNETVTLASGASHTVNATAAIPGGPSEPYVNTASVSCSVAGFPNVLDDSDNHSVELFQPDYTLSCYTSSDVFTVGETIEYQFMITNTSSLNTPDLERVSATSDLLPDVTGSFPDPLADQVVYLYYTVQPTDPETLVHGVTTVYSPSGYPNELERYAECTVTIKAGCMLSPGYWGGGDGRNKWDETLDPVADAAGFTTGDYFGYPFVVDGQWYDYAALMSDDPTPLDGRITWLDIFGLAVKGDVTRQLSFKYVAAKLNVALADVLTLPVPSALGTLLPEIEAYFLANPVGTNPQGAAKNYGRDLLSQLNAIFAEVGEAYCPSTGDIPEN